MRTAYAMALAADGRRFTDSQLLPGDCLAAGLSGRIDGLADFKWSLTTRQRRQHLARVRRSSVPSGDSMNDF